MRLRIRTTLFLVTIAQFAWGQTSESAKAGHSRGKIRDRTLRSARENRQNDLSFSF